MPTDSECECDVVSKEWLLGKLRSDERDTLLIDCRSSNEYAVSHIRSAVNFSIPSIMLRRLAAGKIELASTVQCAELKARLAACRARGVFVLYGEGARPDPDSVHGILLRRLKQDGVHVVCLEGDFVEFHRAYPEWCSEAGAQHVPHLPLMGLRSLRISGSGCDESLSSGSSSECEDAAPHQQDFPVEILPNLYLGNSSNSEDCEALAKHNIKTLRLTVDFLVEILPNLYLGNSSNSEEYEALARHNIKYVLNVTPDLPNTFEAEGCGINYLKIPIADHWSQNMAVHFPQAIRFIEEAMGAGCGVLVHCVAGVSRSVTVTLAYLMQRHRLCLRDAFELVRARKTDIAPNFHFMRQLHSFERDLGLHERAASLSKVLEELGVRELLPPDSGVGSAGAGAPRAAAGAPAAPCGCAAPQGVSPDSGIEFDRWSAARDTPQ